MDRYTQGELACKRKDAAGEGISNDILFAFNMEDMKVYARLETDFNRCKDDGVVDGQGTEGIENAKRGGGVGVNCKAFG